MKAARLPFDPRWSLVFTPHSSNPEPALIKQARSSLWWDDSPALRRPQEIRAGARRARDLGVTGYVPSLEAFTFVATEAEEGQAWLKGRRQVPLGFGWLESGDPPYDELPMRVQRVAYREFSRNPDLSFEAYKEILGRDLFGAASTPQAVDDVLELQAAFNSERTWCQPSPLASPERVRAMRPGRPDAAEAGRVPGRSRPTAGDRGPAPGAEVGRRAGTAPDRPVGARPMGGRGGKLLEEPR